MPNQNDKTLARIRTKLLTTFSDADWKSYYHLVGWLRDTDVASHALKVGDEAPDFLGNTVSRAAVTTRERRRGRRYGPRSLGEESKLRGRTW
jgi:hypothetical protein